jgi:hypothetical protein
MNPIPLLGLIGMMSYMAYQISKKSNAGGLTFILHSAVYRASQLGILIIVDNPFNQTFTQNKIQGTVFINGINVGTISNMVPFSIDASTYTRQGFIINVSAANLCNATGTQVRVLGTVDLDNITMPIDVKYKLL